MDTPEQLVKYGTQDDDKQKQKHNSDSSKKSGLKSGAREWSFIFVSYMTPAVLLVYTVKSGKSIGSDRGKKTST